MRDTPQTCPCFLTLLPEFFGWRRWHSRLSLLGRIVRQKSTKTASRRCKRESCGKRFRYSGKGRPRDYCSAGCYREAQNERRRVVPAYVYRDGHYIPNPSPWRKYESGEPGAAPASRIPPFCRCGGMHRQVPCEESEARGAAQSNP